MRLAMKRNGVSSSAGAEASQVTIEDKFFFNSRFPREVATDSFTCAVVMDVKKFRGPETTYLGFAIIMTPSTLRFSELFQCRFEGAPVSSKRIKSSSARGRFRPHPVPALTLGVIRTVSGLVFIILCGPQAHCDSQDWLPHI